MADEAPADGDEAGEPLTPIGGLTQALAALVAAVIVLPAIALAATGTTSGLAGGPGTAGGTGSTVLAAAAAVLAIAWIVVAIVWMVVARGNAQRLHPGGTWNVAWAVAAWLVPLAHLVLGYFVMRDIWHGTFHRGRPWAKPQAPRWLLAGWLVWAVPKAVGHLLLVRLGFFWPIGLPGYVALPVLGLPIWLVQAAWLALDAVAAVLFLRFVVAVADAQGLPREETHPRPATASDP